MPYAAPLSSNNSDYDVIVYGTICLDGIWRIRQFPQAGGYAPVEEEVQMIGGEAANTAMALHKWGVRVALIGNALGMDDDGNLLRSLFERDAHDLDTRFFVTREDAHTPYCLCIASEDGNRTMFGKRFGEMLCSPLPDSLAVSARFFTMDPNAWEAGKDAALTANRHGLSVTAMDYTRDEEVNCASSVIVTSTDHIGERSEEELVRFVSDLRSRVQCLSIITLGARGCLVAEPTSNNVTAYPAYPAPAVIDSTGSGDIFRAGLLYGQVKEWETPKTIRFASAAAALNCGALGGWGGVRSVEEITAFQARSSYPPVIEFQS